MTTQNALNLGLSGSTGTGNFVGSTSPTIVTPKIAQINDTNGNAIFELTSQASAVNYIGVYNSGAGAAPFVYAGGATANNDIGILPSGSGTTALNTTSTIGFKVTSGTGYQHQTLFIFPNTTGAIQVTYQDTNGTVCVDASGSGSITTTPPASFAPSLALGTPFQNTLGYDVVITVYLAFTSAVSASILLGVGPSSVPTQQTIASSLTFGANLITVPIYLPAAYYALLSIGGTYTVGISGQQGMPV